MEASIADIAAVTRDNGGFGGSNGLWLFAILALMGGGFGGWNRGSDFGQYATAASQQEILFGQRFSNLDNKLDRLGNGIADATYALNNTITGEGRALQSQIATGFCETQKAIHAEGEATRAMIQQDKIASLQGQISQLQLQAAMCGVVRYPMATTYTSGGNPFCGYCNGY